MKNKFFKFIQMDKDLIKDFCDKHIEMNKYIDYSAPFHVRVGKKLYPTLIHTIITQADEENELINFKLETLAKKLKFKISPKKVDKISLDGLTRLVGQKNALLIKTITQDIVNKKLNLKKLAKSNENEIISKLTSYHGLSISVAKIYALFGCFKQNILCYEEKEFINGLKIFLDKQEITQKDIDNISEKYKGQLTIFSLCMFKINNEKVGK